MGGEEVGVNLDDRYHLVRFLPRVHQLRDLSLKIDQVTTLQIINKLFKPKVSTMFCLKFKQFKDPFEKSFLQEMSHQLRNCSSFFTEQIDLFWESLSQTSIKILIACKWFWEDYVNDVRYILNHLNRQEKRVLMVIGGLMGFEDLNGIQALAIIRRLVNERFAPEEVNSESTEGNCLLDSIKSYLSANHLITLFNDFNLETLECVTLFKNGDFVFLVSYFRNQSLLFLVVPKNH
ncbi:unnamed protein product, partial [Mesorhabditis belari]|uniref:Uncharacterized protein n=1 Tax=Mesorhabditis belari TaxID=2138241 RepID=A0AAF3FQR3_9BILA